MYAELFNGATAKCITSGDEKRQIVLEEEEG